MFIHFCLHISQGCSFLFNCNHSLICYFYFLYYCEELPSFLLKAHSLPICCFHSLFTLRPRLIPQCNPGTENKDIFKAGHLSGTCLTQCGRHRPAGALVPSGSNTVLSSQRDLPLGPWLLRGTGGVWLFFRMRNLKVFTLFTSFKSLQRFFSSRQGRACAPAVSFRCSLHGHLLPPNFLHPISQECPQCGADHLAPSHPPSSSPSDLFYHISFLLVLGTFSADEKIEINLLGSNNHNVKGIKSHKYKEDIHQTFNFQNT